MVLARRLTRGLGEKVQAKNIRMSEYPQTGLDKQLIPNAVNTTLSGTDIVSIRVHSKSEPSSINSFYSAFNQSNNTLGVPFFNAKKGGDGYGVTHAIEGWGGFESVGNKAWGTCYLKEGSSVRHKSYRSTINSINYNNIQRLPTLAPTFSFDEILTTGLSGTSSIIFVSANRAGQLAGINWSVQKFPISGVSNTVTNKRDKFIADFITFMDSTSLYFLPQLATEHRVGDGNTFSLGFTSRLRVSKVDHYGTLTYSQTNTNQNKNAAWLLNQRTQYQRKFDPLKTLTS